MIGTTISHYQILEKLGEGGMGIVYKAQDTQLDRTVALKFLPAHLASSSEEKARFLQEAKSAASLSHPNICTIFAIEEYVEQAETDSRFFFAMEYVTGTTLRNVMKDLSLQRALDIGSQVAEGLAAAHDKGIVHRDIKAENIMARPDGRVQIMDFGLAKAKGGPQLTKAGSTVGTIGYISPEQIQGVDADHRADIFSFGVLLYEMSTGHLPFRGVHEAAIMYEIVNVQPQHPADVKPGVPPELERIIMKCLAKDREERYQSAHDIAVDLKVLKKQSGSSVAANAPVVSPEHVAGVPDTTPSQRDSGAMGSSAPTRKTKPLLVGLAAAVVLLCTVVLWYLLSGKPHGTISSMIVLPFENVGANPDLEYLSDGVTEGIINKMSRVPDLRVIPRSASFRLKGSEKDPKSIGEELGVDAVLSGRVVQRGGRLDITLELIDVREYAQMWGESYKRTMDDLMTVQDEIVGEVTRKIRSGATSGTARSEKSETKDPAAYRLYLQGKFYWNKRTASDLERALNYFNQAIALDPDFARAHLGLAETYILQGQYSDKRSSVLLKLAESEVVTSLKLDNSLGEAHAALGMIRQSEWDWEGAEREYKLAIEKAPAYATSYHWYSIFLLNVGRNDEALAVIRKGAEIDPYSPIILVNVASLYMRKDEYVTAGEVVGKILSLDPQFFFGQVFQSGILQKSGKTQEGLDVLNKIKLAGLSSDNLGYVGNYYAQLGAREKAHSVLSMLRDDTKRQHPDPVAVALVYAGLGSKDSTMIWLQKAMDQEEKSRTLANTRGNGEFRLIQKDPRYIALLNKMGLK